MSPRDPLDSITEVSRQLRDSDGHCEACGADRLPDDSELEGHTEGCPVTELVLLLFDIDE